MKDTHHKEKDPTKPGGDQVSTVGCILAIIMIVPSFVTAGLPSVAAFVVSVIGYCKTKKGDTARRKAIIGMVISLLTILAVIWVYSTLFSQYLKICYDLRGNSDIGSCIDFFTTGRIM